MPPPQQPPGICDVMPGPVGSLACGAKDLAGAAAQGAASSALSSAADTFAQGSRTMAETLLTFWTVVPTPDLTDPNGPVAFMRESTSWITAFVLIISLILAGAKMAITQSFEAGQDAAKGVWQMVLYAAAGIPGIFLLGVAGDKFSSWIIQRSTGQEFAQRMDVLFNVGKSLGPLGTGVILIMALFGIGSALAQMFLMIARIGMLVLLAGLLPMAAAAAVSKGGKQWLSKTLGWLLAFAAYKPAAAIVYATAFALVGKSDNPLTVLSGLFLISLSILALPALMRVAVPVTASIAAGSGSGAGAGAVSGMGSMATGAMQLRSSTSGGGGGSSSSGSKSPSSPSGASHSGGTRGGGGGSTASTGGKTAASTGSQTAGSTGAAAGKGAASTAGAAGAGAAAGGVGAGVSAGVQITQKGTQAMRQAGESSAGSGSGPTGSEGGSQ